MVFVDHAVRGFFLRVVGDGGGYGGQENHPFRLTSQFILMIAPFTLLDDRFRESEKSYPQSQGRMHAIIIYLDIRYLFRADQCAVGPLCDL